MLSKKDIMKFKSYKNLRDLLKKVKEYKQDENFDYEKVYNYLNSNEALKRHYWVGVRNFDWGRIKLRFENFHFLIDKKEKHIRMFYSSTSVEYNFPKSFELIKFLVEEMSYHLELSRIERIKKERKLNLERISNEATITKYAESKNYNISFKDRVIFEHKLNEGIKFNISKREINNIVLSKDYSSIDKVIKYLEPLVKSPEVLGENIKRTIKFDLG